MTFEKIDATFYQWAADHNLQVYTDCKDEEVRMVRMYGDGKEFADIGVSEAPNGRYQVNVGIGSGKGVRNLFPLRPYLAVVCQL